MIQAEEERGKRIRAKKTSMVKYKCLQTWGNFRRLHWLTQLGIVLQFLVLTLSVASGIASLVFSIKAKDQHDMHIAQITFGAFALLLILLGILKWLTDASFQIFEHGAIKSSNQW